MHSLTLVLAAATLGLAFAASDHLTQKSDPVAVRAVSQNAQGSGR